MAAAAKEAFLIRSREGNGRLISVSCTRARIQNALFICGKTWHGLGMAANHRLRGMAVSMVRMTRIPHFRVLKGTTPKIHSIRFHLYWPFPVAYLFILGRKGGFRVLLSQVGEKSSDLRRPTLPPSRESALPSPAPHSRTHSLIRVTDSSSIFNAAQK